MILNDETKHDIKKLQYGIKEYKYDMQSYIYHDIRKTLSMILKHETGDDIKEYDIKDQGSR